MKLKELLTEVTDLISELGEDTDVCVQLDDGFGLLGMSDTLDIVYKANLGCVLIYPIIDENYGRR